MFTLMAHYGAYIKVLQRTCPQTLICFCVWNTYREAGKSDLSLDVIMDIYVNYRGSSA